MYRKTKAIAAAVLLALMASMALTACGSSSDSGSGSDYRIALVTGDNHDPFFVSMNAGAQAEAKRLGVEVDWQGPAVYEPAQQIPILNTVLQSKPDFLLTSPTDRTALIPTLKQFQSADIPVIAMDTDIDDPSLRLARISSDNLEGGKLGAKELARAIGEKGKVLLINQAPGILVLDERQQGFEQQIKKYPNIDYLGVRFTQDDPVKTAEAVKAVIARDPDLAGVFAIDTLSGEGTITGIKDAGKQDQVKVVAFDASPSEVEALKTGSIESLIVQRCYDMGVTAVRDAVKYLEDGTKPKDPTIIPYVIANQQNANDPGVSRYYYKAK